MEGKKHYSRIALTWMAAIPTDKEEPGERLHAEVEVPFGTTRRKRPRPRRLGYRYKELIHLCPYVKQMFCNSQS